jgi:hypothetical protein
VRHALQQDERRAPHEAAEDESKMGHGGEGRGSEVGCQRSVAGRPAFSVGSRSLLAVASRIYHRWANMWIASIVIRY